MSHPRVKKKTVFLCTIIFTLALLGFLVIVTQLTDLIPVQWSLVAKSDDHYLPIRPIRVKNISCAEIIRNDPIAIKKAQKYMKTHPRQAKPDGAFAKGLTSCSKFQTDKGYRMGDVSEEERSFPIAFSIMLYKDTEQVGRLLSAIYRPQNQYCLHVDITSKPGFLMDMKMIAKCFPNVHIASRLVDVRWGEFSQTEAELICMKDLLNYATWRYLINLTGQEFPLKTNLQLVRILKVLNGSNDISGTRDKKFLFRTKYRYKHWKIVGKKSPAPHSINITKGSIHLIASRAYIDFIINDKRAQNFTEWVKDTRNPDETLFSSLNHNPNLHIPGSYKPHNINKPSITRYKVWVGSKGHCHGKYQRQICLPGIEDLIYIVNSWAIFINKFEYKYQPLVYDCLEEWHFNRTRDEYKGHYRFSTDKYKKLPQITNHV